MSTTFVQLNTYVHSVTYVSEKILLCLKEIIRESGLDPSKLVRNWDVYQRGIATWMKSQHLVSVHLEVLHPRNNALLRRWDFVIEYEASGELGMWVDTDDIRYHLKKMGVVPSRCGYRIVVETKPGSSNLQGWRSTSFSSTEDLTRYAIGTTISGDNDLSTRTFYWSKDD